MAASTNNNLEMSASISGILNEKHCPEHLQVLKTFTSALRDEKCRYDLSHSLLVASDQHVTTSKFCLTEKGQPNTNNESFMTHVKSKIKK